MANKCLRRCLRFGVSFFVSSGTLASASPPAARKLSCTQGLLKLHSSGVPCSGASHNYSSFSSPTSFPYSSADKDDLSAIGDLVDDQTLLACSGSNCKVQSRKQPVRASLKAMPHDPVQAGPSFHYGLNDTESCKCGKSRESGAEVAISGSKLHTRSWSSPSLLHMPRPMLRLPRRARSARASPNQDFGSGRCAPKGHVAVYVESTQEQQVVPIAYLSHPRFQGLLERAQEEYGFRQQGPGLRLPCSLSELHHTLHHIRSSVLQRKDTR